MIRPILPLALALTLPLAILLGSVTGCATPESRRVWMARFFDGVPVPGTVPSAPDSESPAAAPPRDTLIIARRSAPADPAAVPVSVHPPYARRECQDCHAERFSHALRSPPDQLCLGCHPKVIADAPFVHNPVANGECLACHHPHATETRHLLRHTAPTLCLQCHDAEFLSPAEAHRNAAQADCTLCHDPHRSANAHYLRGAGGTPARASP